jgi:hypothetical protein
MGKLTPLSTSDWAKEEKQIHARIAKLKSKSKAFAELDKDINYDEDPDVQTKCKLARRVFEESLDMFEDGEFTWDAFVSDLNSSLNAIKNVKAIDMAQEDEAEEIGK